MRIEDVVLDIYVLHRMLLSQQLEQILHSESLLLVLIVKIKEGRKRVDKLVLDDIVRRDRQGEKQREDFLV